MNSKLYLAYCDVYTKDLEAKIVELEIERETGGQFRLGANPLYTQILNKHRFIDGKFFISPTATFLKHIIIWGEENIPEGMSTLIRILENDVAEREQKLHKLQKQLGRLKGLYADYEK